TVRLFDINPGAGNSTPVLTPNTDVAENAFFNFNGTLYFGANDGTNGIELYATNGTTASLVRDICSGGCSSTPHNFAVAGNRLFFNAKDSSGGEELWATDGTFGGTTRVADLEPGTGGSNPQSLTASGNLLYFSAFTLTGGITTYIACSDPVASFTVTGPAAAVSGASFSVGVSPRDASNGIVPCYTGSIQLTSDDPNAVLPTAFAHAAGEDVHSASVTLRGLGSHTITARDTINNAIVGVLNVTVGASPVTSTVTASPTAIVANGVTTSTITVRLKDADGNNLTTGAGTLSLATTRGVLSSITNNNDGTYRATLTSGIVSGPAVVTGTLDGTAMTNSATVQFLAGAAASLDISTPSGATAGVAFTMTVTAHDSNGNVADTYGGTVHFSVNDPSSTLPANYTFQAADNGVHTFTNGVVLHTIGNRTINAADVGTPSINGVAIVTVVGATTTSLQSSANPVVAGTSITLTATVTSDALGGSPAGSVTFKDGASPLATVTLASGSAGFSTSSLGSGTHNLTATFNPSNGSFTTSTSSAIAEFVGSVAAPVIDASYDSVANKVVITFSNVPPGATGVDVLVSTNNQDFVPVGSAAVATGFVDDDQPPSNQTRLYVAHAHDGSNVPGLDSNIDPATTIAFPDDPLGTSAAVHAADIAQVRIAVDFFRATVGLLPAVYTHATIGVGDPIRGADWDETRTQLEDARGHVQRLTVVPPYADPTPLSGTPIRGQDYLDLLARLK
ncbi:MAG: invasin domain 3-containing protein, partial [Thermoanaerobaculia bacterium]